MLDKELGYLNKEERKLVSDFRELSDKAQEYILFQIKIALQNE